MHSSRWYEHTYCFSLEADEPIVAADLRRSLTGMATDKTTLHALIRACILRISLEMVRLVVCSLVGMALFERLAIRILLNAEDTEDGTFNDRRLFCHGLPARDRGLGKAPQFNIPVAGRTYLVCTPAVNNEPLDESGHSLCRGSRCRAIPTQHSADRSPTRHRKSRQHTQRDVSRLSIALKPTQDSRHRLLPRHGPPGRSMSAPGLFRNSAYIPTRTQGSRRTLHSQQNRDRAFFGNAEHNRGHRPSGTARERERHLAEFAVRECDSCAGCCRESALLREKGTFLSFCGPRPTR